MSHFLVEIMDIEKIISEDSQELLVGKPKPMFHTVITKCQFSIEFFVHLRIIDEIDSFSSIEYSFEWFDFFEICLDECRFSTSVISHDSDTLSTHHRDFSDEKKWIGTSDKTIFREKNLVARFCRKIENKSWLHGDIWLLDFFVSFERFFSALRESSTTSRSESIDKCFFFFDKFLVSFPLLYCFCFPLCSFFDIIRIVSVVDIHWSTWLHLDRKFTGLIEEFSVMTNDKISASPFIVEIILEPFDTGKVDKIRRFIEKKEIWSKEQNFRKCDFRPLTSTHLREWPVKKCDNPKSIGNFIYCMMIFISTMHLERMKEISIFMHDCLIILFCCYALFKNCELGFHFFEIRKSIFEILTDCARLIIEMNLRKISDRDTSKIIDRTIILGNISGYHSHQGCFSDSIPSDKRHSI